jgi:MFS family permease
MDPITIATAVLTAIPTAILRAFWEIARRPILLAAVIFAFVVGAVLSLVLSGVVYYGWWQSFFQNVGVSLLFVGVVNLGILNSLRGLIEGERTQRASSVTLDPQVVLKVLGQPGVEHESQVISEAAVDRALLEQVRDALEKVEQRLAGSG